MSEEGNELKRAEWGVVLSLIVSALNLAWTAGVVWTQVQDHDRRLAKIESRLDDMVTTVDSALIPS